MPNVHCKNLLRGCRDHDLCRYEWCTFKSKCLSRKQFLSIKFDTSPPAQLSTRMCVLMDFMINIHQQHPQGLSCLFVTSLPLREAVPLWKPYSITLVVPQRPAPATLAQVHPQQFWPESWSGSSWRWLIVPNFGSFFWKGKSPNISRDIDIGWWNKLARWLKICKIFMQLHAWGFIVLKIRWC